MAYAPEIWLSMEKLGSMNQQEFHNPGGTTIAKHAQVSQEENNKLLQKIQTES